MSQRLKAIYRKGTFVPEAPPHLPEGAEVELIIEGPTIMLPEVTDARERERILEAMIQRIQQNPIPPGAPPLTRDALHERR